MLEVLLPSVIGAVGALGSGILGSQGASDQNAANRAMMNKKMVWDLKVANSAHQRQVADLKAAGLNPLLSVNRGAASPQAAMAHMENTAKAGIEAANTYRSISAQVKNLAEDTKLKAEQNKTQQEMQKQIAATINKLEADTKVSQNTATSVDIQNRINSISAQLYEDNPWLKNIEDISGAIGIDLRDLIRKSMPNRSKGSTVAPRGN